MPGILCRIDFQLMQHFVPPVREFKVLLSRLKLPDFVADETGYSPLTMDLPGLMSLVYKRNIVPPGKYWEFTDERGLEEQLAHVQSLLMDYGIPWLEDPLSKDGLSTNESRLV